MASAPTEDKAVKLTDFKKLLDLLYPMRSKYSEFGIQIGLLPHDIDAIEMDKQTTSARLSKVLADRIEYGKPLLWNDIEKALRSKPVSMHKLAEEVREYILTNLDNANHEHEPCSNKDESYSPEAVGECCQLGKSKKKVQVQQEGENEETISSSSSSEDLSQRYKIDLNRSQNKSLKRLFNAYFGQLCCAINDPTEMAAYLQSRGLISISDMKDIYGSSKSNQEKVIQLVTLLQKRIKQSPDMIFILIKELLQITALQNIGQEMMEKAGETCPVEVADIFSIELQGTKSEVQLHPPNTPVQSSTQTESCSNADTNTNVQDVPHRSQHSSSSLNTSEAEVELAPKITPSLKRYKKYLQSVYSARSLAPPDKYLPTLESPYINLAMVTRYLRDPERVNDFTKQTLHGGVDQILANKIPIKMEDLLSDVQTSYGGAQCSGQPEGNQFKRRCSGGFVLVEGPPGIGKSTFAWEYCMRWDEIENLRQFLIVLLLKLREKWVLNATSLSDLFRCQYNQALSEDIAAFFAESNGRNLLLILDGFDEVSHTFHEDSVIKSILSRELLPECTIVLTTRPSAIAFLRSFCQPHIDKHIEIIGFTEEERVRYIIEVFSQEPELQVNFLKYMFILPHIKSMMYVPLNCAIIATVYHESQINRRQCIPRTRTQLYEALTNCILVRHMTSKEGNTKPKNLLPKGLLDEDEKRFKELAKFAFNSYHKQPRKVTFFNEDIPEGLVHFGFMNETNEMYAEKGLEKILSFLHLSLQEYLAAWHIAHTYCTRFQIAYHRIIVEARQSTRSEIFGDGIPQSIVNFQLYSQNRVKLLNFLLYKLDQCTGHEEIELTEFALPPLSYRQTCALYYAHLTLLYLRLKEVALLESIEPIAWWLVEPAVFLAGITGWKTQLGYIENYWEHYLGHVTFIFSDCSLLTRSLYEAQNPSLLPHFFSIESRRLIEVGPGRSLTTQSQYDCYALSYCLSKSSGTFSLQFTAKYESDISCMEVFVKGMSDHSQDSANISITNLAVDIAATSRGLLDRKCLLLLSMANVIKVKAMDIACHAEGLEFIEHFLLTQCNLKKLKVSMVSPEGDLNLKWLPILQHFTKLQELIIDLPLQNYIHPPKEYFEGLPQGYKFKNVHLSFNLPIYSRVEEKIRTLFSCPLSDILNNDGSLNRDNDMVLCTDSHFREILYSEEMIGSILRLCTKSNQLTILTLPNRSISRGNMSDLSNVLRQCNNLKSLNLGETRLGYDGILFICNTLRHNKLLTKLSIYDDGPLQPQHNIANSTDFLLELNHILKENSTLQEIHIQCGFFSCFNNNSRYILWTGFGPLDRINTGSLVSGRSANLKRSYSTSHLTLPKSSAYHYLIYEYKWEHFKKEINSIHFKEKCTKRNININKRVNSCQSFTAPNIQVLQAFSRLDSRLQRCLGILDLL